MRLLAVCVARAWSRRLPTWDIRGGCMRWRRLAALVVTLLLCRHDRDRWAGWAWSLCAGTLVTVLDGDRRRAGQFRRRRCSTVPARCFRARPGQFAIGLGGAMRSPSTTTSATTTSATWATKSCEPGPDDSAGGDAFGRRRGGDLFDDEHRRSSPWCPGRRRCNRRTSRADSWKLYGRAVAVAFTWLIIWTAVACVFAMTLGYSRIPYAAAKAAIFSRHSAYLDPVRQYPAVSLCVARRADGGVLLLFARRRHHRGGHRADRAAVHRPDRGAARAANDPPDVKRPFRCGSIRCPVPWRFLVGCSSWAPLVGCSSWPQLAWSRPER